MLESHYWIKITIVTLEQHTIWLPLEKKPMNSNVSWAASTANPQKEDNPHLNLRKPYTGNVFFV